MIKYSSFRLIYLFFCAFTFSFPTSTLAMNGVWKGDLSCGANLFNNSAEFTRPFEIKMQNRLFALEQRSSANGKDILIQWKGGLKDDGIILENTSFTDGVESSKASFKGTLSSGPSVILTGDVVVKDVIVRKCQLKLSKPGEQLLQTSKSSALYLQKQQKSLAEWASRPAGQRHSEGEINMLFLKYFTSKVHDEIDANFASITSCTPSNSDKSKLQQFKSSFTNSREWCEKIYKTDKHKFGNPKYDAIWLGYCTNTIGSVIMQLGIDQISKERDCARQALVKKNNEQAIASQNKATENLRKIQVACSTSAKECEEVGNSADGIGEKYCIFKRAAELGSSNAREWLNWRSKDAPHLSMLRCPQF